MDDQLKNILVLVVAVYAAIVSTIVLIWDIYKYRWDVYKYRKSNQPEIAHEILMPRKQHELGIKVDGIAIKIKNIGTLSTTLTVFGYQNFEGFYEKILVDPKVGYNRRILITEGINGSLPYLLNPGEEWVGVLPGNPWFEMEKDITAFTVWVFYYHTLSSSPVHIPLRMTELWEKYSDIESNSMF